MADTKKTSPLTRRGDPIETPILPVLKKKKKKRLQSTPAQLVQACEEFKISLKRGGGSVANDDLGGNPPVLREKIKRGNGGIIENRTTRVFNQISNERKPTTCS